MSTFYKAILFCVALLLNLAVQAQDLRNNPRLRERITEAKLLEIQKALNLSDADLKQLAPVYKRYDAALNELHFARQQSRQEAGLLRTNPDSLSTEEADRLITAHLENAVKISTIRREYYSEFKTVLSPQQVMRLYQSEAQLRRKVMQEVRKRFGNRPR
ncbi:hypothetical protein [Botryobacter ruber]|uniref:hypothetical protein n=1 Tax=Botryobacter ruber TaxID=2171629 RepID=UPI000E0C542A|nr:hypothetical protein [Botryobacter ruber]